MEIKSCGSGSEGAREQVQRTSRRALGDETRAYPTENPQDSWKFRDTFGREQSDNAENVPSSMEVRFDRGEEALKSFSSSRGCGISKPKKFLQRLEKEVKRDFFGFQSHEETRVLVSLRRILDMETESRSTQDISG